MEKPKEKKLIELPKENIGCVSGFCKVNTTPPVGDRGVVEELEKAIKKENKGK